MHLRLCLLERFNQLSLQRRKHRLDLVLRALGHLHGGDGSKAWSVFQLLLHLLQLVGDLASGVAYLLAQGGKAGCQLLGAPLVAQGIQDLLLVARLELRERGIHLFVDLDHRLHGLGLVVPGVNLQQVLQHLAGLLGRPQQLGVHVPHGRTGRGTLDADLSKDGQVQRGVFEGHAVLLGHHRRLLECLAHALDGGHGRGSRLADQVGDDVEVLGCVAVGCADRNQGLSSLLDGQVTCYSEVEHRLQSLNLLLGIQTCQRQGLQCVGNLDGAEWALRRHAQELGVERGDSLGRLAAQRVNLGQVLTDLRPDLERLDEGRGNSRTGQQGCDVAPGQPHGVEARCQAARS